MQRSRFRRPISKIRMILLMDAKTWMTSLIIMFAVRPICHQDSTFKMSSESPVMGTNGPSWFSPKKNPVMVWCCQVTSNYLSQCRPRSIPPYGIIRPQELKQSITLPHFLFNGLSIYIMASASRLLLLHYIYIMLLLDEEIILMATWYYSGWTIYNQHRHRSQHLSYMFMANHCTFCCTVGAWIK